MTIREFFRGDRDEDRGRDRERWRDEWRDENRERQHAGGERDLGPQQRDRERRGGQREDYSSSGGYGGRYSPQYYGSGQDYERTQRWRPQEENGSTGRYSGSDEDRYRGGRTYSSGFYTDESEEGGQYGGGQFGGSRYGGSQYGGGGQYGGELYSGTEYGGERGRRFASTGQFGRSMYGSQQGEYGEGQYRGRGPRGYQRSDDRIREEVCECLTDDSYIDATEIEITVMSGEVTLAGTVNSREEKRRAADVIENLSGVKDVHNNLRVQNEQTRGLQGTQSTQGQSTQGTQGQKGTQATKGTQGTQGTEGRH